MFQIPRRAVCLSAAGSVVLLALGACSSGGSATTGSTALAAATSGSSKSAGVTGSRAASSSSASPSGPDGDANESAPAFVAASRGGLHVSALPGRGRSFGVANSADDPLADLGLDAVAENKLPGAAKWAITTDTPGAKIEGYASAASVKPGEAVTLFVSSSAPTFTVEVLRTGYYGGQWARQVWVSGEVKGGKQGDGIKDPVTNMVRASWKPSLELNTAKWPTGAYLAKLTGSDGAQSYIPLTVRGGASTGTLLMVLPTATWQAYNQWGGPSTYRGYANADKTEDYQDRATAASYDRPYARGRGAATFITGELPVIATAERLGLRLNYANDLDLQMHPEVLDGAVGVILLGHSEYWSRQMRANLTTARDKGANLAFFGANAVHRRIRLADSTLGKGRVIVNYKDPKDDPVKTQDTTADWGRDPYAMAQSSLVGSMFECAHSSGPMVISDPSAWPIADLKLAKGTTLVDAVGPEFDRVNTVVKTPRPIQILAHSPMPCRGSASASDMTWYAAKSGAGVFASGTLNWAEAMGSSDPTTAKVMGTATVKVLSEMARPAAGVRIPPKDNVAEFYSPKGPLKGATLVPSASATTDTLDPDAG